MVESIRYDVSDRIATITLDREGRLNAFTPAMAEAFIAALDWADADDQVRAIIVTGAGRVFSAGADLSNGAIGFIGDKETVIARDLGGLMTLRLFNCLKPVIAAINGPAIGVGATMQLAMDARIASTKASFGFVFVDRGIVPEAASAWFLPRIVGIATALRWCMAGTVVTATEALETGLVSSVVPPDALIATARSVAASFASASPVSVALTRRMLWTMLGATHPMEAHILDSRALHERGRSRDLEEGLAAFKNKRKPDFPDRVSTMSTAVFTDWEARAFDGGM